MTVQHDSLPCPIQCMIFNETAKTIMEILSNWEINLIPYTISLNHYDMSGFEIEMDGERGLVCEGGYVIA